MPGSKHNYDQSVGVKLQTRGYVSKETAVLCRGGGGGGVETNTATTTIFTILLTHTFGFVSIITPPYRDAGADISSVTLRQSDSL